MFQSQPTRLTIDGVITIINNSSFSGQQFTLQILQLKNNYLGHYYGEVSDGYCKLKCQFGEKAKQMVEQQKIINYSIVTFSTQEIQVVNQIHNPYVVIRNCHIINQQPTKVIGSPMPYTLFKQKSHQNPHGSNQIDSSQRTYTIKEITANTRLKNCHLRAQVIQLPDNVSKGMMIFRVKDCEGSEIQCVCFQEAAEQFFKELIIGREYLFSGFVLQKNRRTNEDELKFKKEAKVEHLLGGNLPQRIQPLQQTVNPPLTTNQPTVQPHSLTKLSINKLLSQNTPLKDNFFTTVGKVIYMNIKSKFRKLNIEDSNGDIIDLLLWQQVKQPIVMEKVYKFTSMRVKPSGDSGGNSGKKYVQLHSSKKTTVKLVEDQEEMKLFMKKPSSYKPSFSNRSTTVQKPTHRQSTKRLPQHYSLITLSDLLSLADNDQQSQRENKNISSTPYPFIECCLKLRTQGFKFIYDEQDVLNYFSFYCGQCSKAGTATLDETNGNQITCNRCKRNDVMVKWNLRVKAMDYLNQVPCSLQNETSERFLNLSPKDGYIMYLKDYQKFQVLLHKVNFQQRVCKFQIKTQGHNTFYNILEIYAKDTMSMLERALKQLQNKTKQFEQLSNIVN